MEASMRWVEQTAELAGEADTEAERFLAGTDSSADEAAEEQEIVYQGGEENMDKANEHFY